MSWYDYRRDGSSKDLEEVGYSSMYSCEISTFGEAALQQFEEEFEKANEEQRKFEEAQRRILETPPLKEIKKERKDFFNERNVNNLKKEKSIKVNNYSKQQFSNHSKQHSRHF